MLSYDWDLTSAQTNRGSESRTFYYEIIFEYFEFSLGAGVELCTVMIKDWHAIAAFAFIVQIGFLNKIMSNVET